VGAVDLDRVARHGDHPLHDGDAVGLGDDDDVTPVRRHQPHGRPVDQQDVPVVERREHAQALDPGGRHGQANAEQRSEHGSDQQRVADDPKPQRPPAQIRRATC